MNHCMFLLSVTLRKIHYPIAHYCYGLLKFAHLPAHYFPMCRLDLQLHRWRDTRSVRILAARPDCRENLKKSHVQYKDFTSLYPFINKHEIYLLAHPIVLRNREFERNYALELLRINALQSTTATRPVSPRAAFQSQARRLHRFQTGFTLCRSCAKQANFRVDACTNTVEERALEDVWRMPELELTIEEKYVVLEVYEVWNDMRKKKGLFAQYIKIFQKSKQEAAGWPRNCDTLAEKAEYIRRYKEVEGVELET